MSGRGFLVSLATVLVTAVVGRGAQAAESQSPGDLSRFAVVRDACPTFSWSHLPGASEYELVVYRVAPAGEGGAVETAPSLRRTLPGGASSWTPDHHDCLRPGDRYAWSVRATGAEGESGGWSEPRLLEVVLAGSPELEVAIERALGRVRADDGDRETRPGGGLTTAAQRAEPAPRPGTARPPLPATVLFPGSSALFVEQPDATGTTYGAIGVTQSTDFQAAGVYGEQSHVDGSGRGVLGIARSSGGTGVYGSNEDLDGPCEPDPHGVGVLGTSGHFDGVGVVGKGFIGVWGQAVLGAPGVGVRGVGAGAGTLGGFFSNTAGNDALGVGGFSADPLFKVDADGKVTATGMDMAAFSIQTVSAGSAASSVNSPLCPAGTIRTGGGCRCGTGNPIETSEPDGSGRWTCTCSAAGVVAYSVCLGSA